jgi:hypothetical protein
MKQKKKTENKIVFSVEMAVGSATKWHGIERETLMIRLDHFM